MLTVARESPAQPGIACLFAAADARSASLYPEESRHGLAVSALLAAEVRFFVAREAGQIVGCGGYVLLAEREAELKRLFVLPAARGRGVGGAIIRAAEGAAVAEGVRWLRLETGVKSAEALGLYARLGFTRCGPFGAYGPDPLSVFMVKELISPDA